MEEVGQRIPYNLVWKRQQSLRAPGKAARAGVPQIAPRRFADSTAALVSSPHLLKLASYCWLTDQL